MQNRGIRLTDNFVGLVAIEAARAFIPKHDLSREVFGDHRVLGGRLENIGDEVVRLLSGADNRAIKKSSLLGGGMAFASLFAIHGYVPASQSCRPGGSQHKNCKTRACGFHPVRIRHGREESPVSLQKYLASRRFVSPEGCFR